jgi:2,4-dienoyl-CoA reductase-like NADH-dependent reductase (Old Yellow Enzyme family)
LDSSPRRNKQKRSYRYAFLSSTLIVFSQLNLPLVLQDGQADVVLLARELLRHADFALDAAQALGVVVKPANQYEWGWTRMMTPKKN